MEGDSEICLINARPSMNSHRSALRTLNPKSLRLTKALKPSGVGVKGNGAAFVHSFCLEAGRLSAGTQSANAPVGDAASNKAAMAGSRFMRSACIGKRCRHIIHPGHFHQKPARLQLASTWSKFGSSIVKTFAQSSRMELSKVFTRSISMN